MCWRLLECFKECVCGRPRYLVGLVDDVELGPQLGRSVVDTLPQVANVIDTAVTGRVDLDHIWRGAGIDRNARRTDVAGSLVRVGVEAIGRLGQDSCGRCFARPTRTA